MTLSEDGNWFWNGSEWIPAPPGDMTCPYRMHQPVDETPKLCPESWKEGEIRFISKCAVCRDDIIADITIHWDTKEWISLIGSLSSLACPPRMHQPVDEMHKICPESWEDGEIRFISKCATCDYDIVVDITTHWDTSEWLSVNTMA